MSKQTAIDWLIEQWPILESDLPNWLIDQVKAMEEKNIKDSFVAGAGMGEMFNNENRCYVTDAEKYLKETFKSE